MSSYFRVVCRNYTNYLLRHRKGIEYMYATLNSIVSLSLTAYFRKSDGRQWKYYTINVSGPDLRLLTEKFINPQKFITYLAKSRRRARSQKSLAGVIFNSFTGRL